MKLYQEIYINLLNNLEDVRLARLQNTPNVVSIEAATVSNKPVRPNYPMNIGLSSIVGLLLAGGIAFLVEYLDDTIRTPEDIERVLKLPVVGYIGDINTEEGEFVDLHVLKHPRSPVSEAFRSLRTNLEFANVDRTLNKILVTSSGPSEGKTMIAVNLATILGQGGKRVLLIDADMRRPRIHSIFGISNRVGLSSLFRNNMALRSAMRAVEGLQNVFIITSGSLPPNPMELLASARMDQILMEASQEVDVIIVDSPPSLVADFQVLATKMDGVLMVVQPEYTRADAAFAMVEQLGRVNGNLLGVVLNKIPRNSHYYGGYYHYYDSKKGQYYYRHSDEEQQQLGTGNESPKFLPNPEVPQPTQVAIPAPQPIPVAVPPHPIAAELDNVFQPRMPAEVYAPLPQEESASVEIITKPRKSKGELRMLERPTYVIRTSQLEYWYGDDDDR
jgi:capsular exopolysaccharide synthesis family protein